MLFVQSDLTETDEMILPSCGSERPVPLGSSDRMLKMRDAPADVRLNTAFCCHEEPQITAVGTFSIHLQLNSRQRSCKELEVLEFDFFLNVRPGKHLKIAMLLLKKFLNY